MAFVQKKLLLVGDRTSDKNSILNTYLYGPNEYLPEGIVVDGSCNIQLGDQTVYLRLWNTAFQEDYERLRILSYPFTDVAVMAFSIGHPCSLKNVKDKWIPEVLKCCPNVPIVLVGNNKELRDNEQHINELRKEGLAPVTYKEGKRMAKNILATDYLECSSKNNVGVAAIFEISARRAVGFESKKKSCILF